jgi:GAF domain-containing protein
LAAQLGVAVENANLFSQVQQSREEVERQARRQVHLAYDTYLDAIHKRERMGFEFDRQEVRPLESAAQPLQGRVVSMPINVAGETIGKLELARSDAPWPQDDVEWLRTVTQQISRQVDSLRLLSEADRYRQEAEDAARRLTREGWEAYLAEVSENLAYTYDQDQVLPGAIDEELPPLVQPLAMRGEQIGEISLHGVETLDEERAAMLSTVAERLSEHIESLRLSEQTRSALAATDALYAGSEGVVRAGTSDQVLAAIVNATALKQFERGSIMLFSSPWETRMPDLGTFIATWEASGGPPPTPVGTTYPISMVPFLQMLHKDQPVFVADALNDPRLDPQTLKLLENVGRSLAVFPLVVAEQWIGVLTMVASHAVPLTEAQIRQTQSLIGQGAAVVQGLRLLEETTARARREQVLRQVSERVRSATNPEQVLRLAAREVGAALGRSVLVRMKSTETANTAHEQPGGNGHGAKEGA